VAVRDSLNIFLFFTFYKLLPLYKKGFIIIMRLVAREICEI
jgi:hypothetical protein